MGPTVIDKSPGTERRWLNTSRIEMVSPSAIPSRCEICCVAPSALARLLFWQFWNPIWGYGLGRFVYSPLKRVLPRALAVIMTFAISGGIHDLATMAVRRSPAFLFTPWFFLLGVGVVLGRLTRLDYSDHPWGVRAGINLAYVAICLVVTLIVKRLLPIP